jgi:GAF domain-containing protein
MDERILGVINVESAQLNAFSEADEELLTTFAGQLATAIEKVRLFEATRRQAQELAALYETALATSSVLDTEMLMTRLYQQIEALLAPDSFLVSQYHPQDGEMEVLKAVEEGQELEAWIGKRLSLDQAGLTGWILQEGEPLLVSDMEKDSLPVEPKHATRPARSWLGVPLVFGDDVIGAMSVQSFQPGVFDEGHHRFLESLAAQVAISLVNARLYEESQRHAVEFMRLYETATDLSGEQNLTTLLETIVERACDLLDVPFGGVYLYDALQEEMELVVAKGFPVPLGTRLRLGEGMAGRVAQTREAMTVEDYRTWEGRSSQYRETPFTSILEVPMLYAGELVGVLVVNETAPTVRAFSEAEVNLLSLLAAQAAGAVHSARLFEQTRRRARELEAVATVSAAMRKASNRAEMIPIVVDQLCALLNTEHAGLAMRDPDTGEVTLELGRGVWSVRTGERQEAGVGVSGHVIATGKTYLTDNAQEDPLVARPEMLGEVPAVACVPLSVRQQTIGALWVGRESRISEEEVRLLVSVADITANAIHRSTLHEELQHRAVELKRRNEELARLYRASGALLSSATGDIRSLGQTIVEAVRREFGGANCSLLLVQPDGHGLERVAMAGPYGDQLHKGELDEENLGAIPQVLSAGKIVNIADFSTDGDVKPAWDSARSELAIPLKIGDRVAGVIDVQSNRLAAFSSDDERLMSIFAERAALALENTRLYQQTRRRLERLLALHEIDLAITSSVDLRVILNVLIDQMLTQMNVDAVAVLLYKPSSQVLEYAAGRGFATPLSVGTRVRPDQALPGRAMLEQRAIQISDIREDGQLARTPLLTENGFKGYYALPLIAKGQAKGVLELFHKEDLVRDDEWMNFLETLAAQTAIAIDNVEMFNNTNRMNVELTLAYDTTLEGWSRALELRDHETEGHAKRVTEMTLDLARKMGMSEGELVHVRRGALLHDIGKMGIPDSILLKPGPLTEEEWELMRQHPNYAYNLLQPIPFLKSALDIPYCHHEKWDGSGYPRGLKGEQIPLAARVFAVVDVWDALTTERPYRDAWPEEKVFSHIRDQAGIHFDPEVVRAFIHMMEAREDE